MSPQTMLVFALMLAAISAVLFWLLSHNYASDMALSRWSKVISVLDAEKFRIGNLGLLYPHAPLYSLVPFYVFGLNWGASAPYFASSLFGAALLAIWNHHLKEKNYSLPQRSLFLLLVAIHPYFLWAVTSGTQHALGLLMFYFLWLASVRLLHLADARAFLMFGMALALYFFVDEKTYFIYFALLPLIPLIIHRRMMDESPISVYLVLSTPLIVAGLSWMYLNMTFSIGALEFLESPYATFRGLWPRTPDVDWLRHFGGEFFTPLMYSLAFAVVSFPSAIWLTWRSRRHSRVLHVSEAMFLHVVIASAIATAAFFLAHPVEMLCLFAPGVMAALVLLPRETDKSKLAALYGLLLVGVVGGWLSMQWMPTIEMERWVSAVEGNAVKDISSADMKVGKWLADNRMPTLMDDHVGYRVIVARGDAKQLILPFSHEFQLALRSDNLAHLPRISEHKDFSVDQILVMDPGHTYVPKNLKGEAATTLQMTDMVSSRYFDLYRNGMKGYELVYDQDYWRVYRKIKGSLDVMREVEQCAP